MAAIACQMPVDTVIGEARAQAAQPAEARPRARDIGVAPGVLRPGALNAITDVDGVRVGHVTLVEGSNIRTGVTVILPHGGNLFQNKVPAGFAVGNGFGKFAGATQVEELGEIETPIVLTNTLSVAEGISGLVEWTLQVPGNEQVRSVNAVVGETNDSFLNGIRARRVTKADVFATIRMASTGPVAEGCIGAGTGAVQNSFIMPERLAKTDPFKAINEVVGSGPYRFLKDEFVPGGSAAWEKFDGYVPRQEAAEWSSGRKIANFQRIEWKIITDAATASAALQNGEVDWYEQAQADLVPLLRRNSDIVIAPSNPQGYIGGLRFNCLHPPFDDVRLRRAVLVAVNQEDYMRTIMGADPSAWRVCRSQYPCGSPYGIEVDLPVQKGDLAAARKMIQAAGYHDQKAVIINPTDFPTIGPLGDITYDMFKKIGINAELQSTDWGSVVQRRATREPVEKGGWSVFHTWFTGGFILNPVVSAPFRGLGAEGWFGWYENLKIEQLTQEWLDAEDEDTRKKIAAAIQLENYAQVPTVTLGQFQIPTAYRKSLAGKLEFTGPLFWNLKRA